MERLFKPESTLVEISRGFVFIRELSPTDKISINKLLGEDSGDSELVELATIALSIQAAMSPDYANYPDKEVEEEITENGIVKVIKKSVKETFRVTDPDSKPSMILNPEKPHNYIINPINGQWTIDINKPDNFIADPSGAMATVIDKTKCKVTNFPIPKTFEDLNEVMLQFTSKDWAVISNKAIAINTPNPVLLGK